MNITKVLNANRHEVMEAHLSGDSVYYTEAEVTSAAYACECGRVWAKRWYAETCGERGHVLKFSQKYWYKPEGYATPGSATFGQAAYNEYWRVSIGRMVDGQFRPYQAKAVAAAAA
jgi:hypothetical protein